jgi:hypothetical protein
MGIQTRCIYPGPNYAVAELGSLRSYRWMLQVKLTDIPKVNHFVGFYWIKLRYET